MLTLRVPSFRRAALLVLPLFMAVMVLMSLSAPALAQTEQAGEAHLVLPDLGQATFLGNTNGRTLLMYGLGICVLGLLFGLLTY